MPRKSPTGQKISESGVRVQPPALKPKVPEPLIISPKVVPGISMQPIHPLIQELGVNLPHRLLLQTNEAIAEARRRRKGIFPSRAN